MSASGASGARPPPRLRLPHPRHSIPKVTQRSRTKAMNSVIESWVDVQADIDAINRGEGVHQGETYTVNGRTYGVEPGGRAYPVSGPGIHQLNRGAYRALGVYNTFGQSARAEEILDAMGVGQQQRAAALRAWLAEQGA